MGWRKFAISIIAMLIILGIAWLTGEPKDAVWAVATVAVGFAGGNAIEHLTDKWRNG